MHAAVIFTRKASCFTREAMLGGTGTSRPPRKEMPSGVATASIGRAISLSIKDSSPSHGGPLKRWSRLR